MARPTLIVQDEYDVQDLLLSLLKIDFADADREEWTPKFAGASARSDIVLPSNEIFIETKMTRAGLDDRKLGDELVLDITRFPSHPKCRTLICAVYDPAHRIKNPDRLARDLERMSSTALSVWVRFVF